MKHPQTIKTFKNIIKYLLFSILVLAFIKCGLFETREQDLFRVIDNLSEQNIVESPFKDLLKEFSFIQEEITGKWKYLPELSSHEQEVWGVSSKHRVLGGQKSEKPKQVKLLRNGKEVRYLGDQIKNKKGWRWIKAHQELELKNHPLFNESQGGIILKRGEYFQFNALLSKGKTVVEFRLNNENLGAYNPQLKVYFNNKEIKTIGVTGRKWYRVRNITKLGYYSITVRHLPPEGNYEDHEFIIIDKIKIDNSSDILLLSKSYKEKRIKPQGKFLFEYYTADVAKKQPSSLAENLYLYGMKNKYPLLDWGISENPYSIKQKIEIGEYSLNSLMAPVRSEFKIPIKIPAGAILEFGYGFLLESPYKGSNETINFQVAVEDLKGKKVLFNRELSSAKNKNIFSEKIDLSSYEKKKVEVSFITEKSLSEQEQGNGSESLPIWINPIIYKFPQEEKINIVLISLDTLRPDHLGCYGYRRNTSPNIDRLSQESVLFFNTYSTTSWTLPAHVSMLTSLDCLHHQVYYPRHRMEPETVTVADILRVNQLVCAGFTGGGYLSSKYGFSKGFDSYQEYKIYGNKALRYDEAEYIAEKACKWIQSNRDKNFFLFVHTYQPHEPYGNLSSEGKKFLSENAKWNKVNMGALLKEKGRFYTRFTDEEVKNIVGLYDGEIRYTDLFLVKPLIEELKKSRLYDSTMIIITSDHGEEFNEHEAWLHDHSIYDEGIKIPLIIKFPHSEYKGKKIHEIVRITDIVPTILDHLNIKTGSAEFDGQSLLPLIEQKEKRNRVYVCDLALRDASIQSYPNLIAMNKQNYKLILNREVRSPYVKRVSEKFRGMRIELYDVNNDPNETKNLAHQNQYRDLCFQLLKHIGKIYEKLDKSAKKKEEVVLDKNLRERLRALGYIK